MIIASNGVNIGDNDIRVQNSVKYMIPDYYGLKLTAQYGFSNATGFATNDACGFGIGYEHGPPRWSAVYVQCSHPYMPNGIDGAWIDEATKAAGARCCRRSATSWRRRSRRAERMIN
ncbi:porin [Burkholderia ubonensis]|uniref:porin n=1 Tax=Burkholderia ubonensis TaxID=101571 RepID=UPI00016A5881|nr:porin [Burkholderia ubonensis]